MSQVCAHTVVFLICIDPRIIRCMRHFAIYGQSWPCRISAHGPAFLPTPREESTPVESSTRRVTQKALPALDRKLAAAASSLKRRERSRENSPKDRPSKKRKTERVNRVEMSAKARQTLLGKSGTRTARPSPRSVKNRKDDDEGQKRSRLRVASGRQVSPIDADNSVKLKSLAVQSQPRDSNGRFGKKGNSNNIFMRKKFTTKPSNGGLSRAQRAIERGKVKLWLERKEEEESESDGDASVSTTRKRSRESDNDEEESTAKKISKNTNDSDNSSQPNVTHATLPAAHSSLRFKGMGMSLTPNPMSFARRTWVSHAIPSESSAEDTEVPRTPDDNPLLLQDDDAPKPLSILTQDILRVSPNASRRIPMGELTFKPTPFNFARRRWASIGSSSVDSESFLQNVEDDPVFQSDHQSPRSQNSIIGDLDDEEDETVDIYRPAIAWSDADPVLKDDDSEVRAHWSVKYE
jgi:[histone H4]-N-methyl-L-lysine20 N-methyltransferase